LCRVSIETLIRQLKSTGDWKGKGEAIDLHAAHAPHHNAAPEVGHMRALAIAVLLIPASLTLTEAAQAPTSPTRTAALPTAFSMAGC